MTAAASRTRSRQPDGKYAISGSRYFPRLPSTFIPSRITGIVARCPDGCQLAWNSLTADKACATLSSLPHGTSFVERNS